MNILGIIPARYGSQRFPGKPLAKIAGMPLIEHVVRRCRKAWVLSEVIVATDDTRIADVVKEFCRVEMTAADHPSGTDRIAEVVDRLDCDAVVNIQGDEPLIDPETINAVGTALTEAPMTTAATPIADPTELDNPNVVKVVIDRSGKALYFSRHALPYLRDSAQALPETRLRQHPFLKHLGIYGFRRDTLLELVRYPVSRLEKAEKLEQLRALENGIAIAVVKVSEAAVGVDTPADVWRVEALIRQGSAADDSGK